MKMLTAPSDNSEWAEIASAILRANLKLARMNLIDLSNALKKIGIDETPKNISSKLSRGSFSAAFFLQVLHVIGVETLTLPSG